jgi:flagellum-specific peptidoglycan hydrolase FlgJ
MELLLLRQLRSDARLVYPDEPIMQQLVVTQAVHESGYLTNRGASQLASKYNNLFGIKGSGTGGKVLLPTWEYINGREIQVKDYFAIFKSVYDAFLRHKDLMSKERYKPVRAAKTLNGAFRQLQVCGYATDPKYPKKLMDVHVYLESITPKPTEPLEPTAKST